MSRPCGHRRTLARLAAVVLVSVLAACSSGGSGGHMNMNMGTPAAPPPPATTASATNVYAATNVGMFQPATRGVPYRLYVPNHSDGTVSVVDPVAKKVLYTF